MGSEEAATRLLAAPVALDAFDRAAIDSRFGSAQGTALTRLLPLAAATSAPAEALASSAGDAAATHAAFAWCCAAPKAPGAAALELRQERHVGPSERPTATSTATATRVAPLASRARSRGPCSGAPVAATVAITATPAPAPATAPATATAAGAATPAAPVAATATAVATTAVAVAVAATAVAATPLPAAACAAGVVASARSALCRGSGVWLDIVRSFARKASVSSLPPRRDTLPVDFLVPAALSLSATASRSLAFLCSSCLAACALLIPNCSANSK